MRLHAASTPPDSGLQIAHSSGRNFAADTSVCAIWSLAAGYHLHRLYLHYSLSRYSHKLYEMAKILGAIQIATLTFSLDPSRKP